jgi:hypothetical protein
LLVKPQQALHSLATPRNIDHPPLVVPGLQSGVRHLTTQGEVIEVKTGEGHVLATPELEL